jgi:hypothetical protein
MGMPSRSAAFMTKHGPNEGVVSGSDIWKINQEQINVLEHAVGGFSMLSVQRINWKGKVICAFTFPFDHVVLSGSEQTVLWSEYCVYSKFPAYMAWLENF